MRGGLRTARPLLSLCFALGLAAAACSDPPIIDLAAGEISFTPERPAAPDAPRVVARYQGADSLILEAQSRYVTGLDLHRKLVLRSCGGTNGVCHNQKEYPDLHTQATFASAIGAPCNLQPGSWSSVFDRCERPGDRFRLGEEGKDIEVAWIESVPGEPIDYSTDFVRPFRESPGIHLYLAEPVDLDGIETYARGIFIRTFIDSDGNVNEFPFITFETQWWILDAERRHLFAEVPENLDEEREALIASGIVQGDHNRNGIHGYRAGRFVTLLNPGKAEESYLVARLRGQMQGEKIPGTRMPLANQPPSIPDMLALMCFVEQLDPAKSAHNLEDGIDYNTCSYSADPRALNLVGQGVTFSGRIKPLLAANCGGCHGGDAPQAGLDLLSDGVFERMLLASKQQPLRKLITPGSPQNSYLWLKLTGDGSISNSRMPLDPLNGGSRELAPEELADIETWILAGALND